MRRLMILWAVLGLSLFAAAPASAIPGSAFASEAITVSTVAIQITQTLCRVGSSTGTPTAALVEVITNAINYTLEGTTPSSATHYLAAGGYLEVKDALRLTMIRNGGSDATVWVTCFQ